MSLRYDRFWSERYNLNHREIFELRKGQKTGEEQTAVVQTKVIVLSFACLLLPSPLTAHSGAEIISLKIKSIYKEGREKRSEKYEEKREETTQALETRLAQRQEAVLEKKHARVLKEEQYKFHLFNFLRQLALRWIFAVSFSSTVWPRPNWIAQPLFCLFLIIQQIILLWPRHHFAFILG